MIDICIIIFLLISFLYICYFCKSYINGGNTKKLKKHNNKNLNKKKKYNTINNINTNNNIDTNTHNNTHNNINTNGNNNIDTNIIDSDLYSTPDSHETDNNIIPLNFKDFKKNFSDIKFNIGDKILLLKNNKLGIIINNKTDEEKKYLIKLLHNNKELYEYENNIKLI